MEFDTTDKKVIYNGKKVNRILREEITFDDDTKLYNQSLAYEISDFWKSEVEKDTVIAPKVKLTLEDCLAIIKRMSKKNFYYIAHLANYIADYKHIKPSEYIKSEYDPRDNDYCESTYTACIYKQTDDFVTDFLELLRKNNYIKKITKTTVYFQC